MANFHWLDHIRPNPVADLMPRPLEAAKLMPRQLNKKPANLIFVCERSILNAGTFKAHLKNATREIDLSSNGVREDAKMERRTAGVTGMPLSGGACPTGSLEDATVAGRYE